MIENPTFGTMVVEASDRAATSFAGKGAFGRRRLGMEGKMVAWISRMLNFLGHIVAHLVKEECTCLAFVIVLAWVYVHLASKAAGVSSWR